jgi:hypothetical protein
MSEIPRVSQTSQASEVSEISELDGIYEIMISLNVLGSPGSQIPLGSLRILRSLRHVMPIVASSEK